MNRSSLTLQVTLKNYGEAQVLKPLQIQTRD